MDGLNRLILDNTVRSYLIVFVVIGITLLLRHWFSHGITQLLLALMQKKGKRDDRRGLISLTIKPLGRFLVILVTILAIDRLHYPVAWMLSLRHISLHTVLRKAGTVAVIVSFFLWVLSFITFVSSLLARHARRENDRGHGQVITFFRDLLKVIVGLIAVLIVLKAAFNQNIGTLLTGLSIVGAALALAAKESLENLIASFVIFFDKPFFTGDGVKVNSVSGTVERIGLRSTRIRTADKTLVTVPNKQMVDSIVDNTSMIDQRHGLIKLALSEHSDPAVVQDALADIKKLVAEYADRMLSSSVLLSDYSKDGAVITIEYFTDTYAQSDFDQMKEKIQLGLMKLLRERDLQMTTAAGSINIVNPAAGAGKPNPIV